MQLDNNLIRILTSFDKQNAYGFTELAEKLRYGTDLTGYYLRKLEHQGYIARTGRGMYQITPLGKSTLAQSHQFSDLNERPRITVILVAQHKDKYLMVKRTKQPFMNVIEFPVLPIARGGELMDGVQRALKDRVGVNLSVILRGFFRRIDIYNETTFDDKFFAVCMAKLTAGHGAKLYKKNSQGELNLKSKDTLAQENISKSLFDIVDFVQSTDNFAEKIYQLSDPDLYV